MKKKLLLFLCIIMLMLCSCTKKDDSNLQETPQETPQEKPQEVPQEKTDKEKLVECFLLYGYKSKNNDYEIKMGFDHGWVNDYIVVYNAKIIYNPTFDEFYYQCHWSDSTNYLQGNYKVKLNYGQNNGTSYFELYEIGSSSNMPNIYESEQQWFGSNHKFSLFNYDRLLFLDEDYDAIAVLNYAGPTLRKVAEFIFENAATTLYERFGYYIY